MNDDRLDRQFDSIFDEADASTHGYVDRPGALIRLKPVPGAAVPTYSADGFQADRYMNPRFGAGMRLGRELLRDADRLGIHLTAIAGGNARLGYYKKAGFETVGNAMRNDIHQLVRKPKSID